MLIVLNILCMIVIKVELRMVKLVIKWFTNKRV